MCAPSPANDSDGNRRERKRQRQDPSLEILVLSASQPSEKPSLPVLLHSLHDPRARLVLSDVAGHDGVGRLVRIGRGDRCGLDGIDGRSSALRVDLEQSCRRTRFWSVTGALSRYRVLALTEEGKRQRRGVISRQGRDFLDWRDNL